MRDKQTDRQTAHREGNKQNYVVPPIIRGVVIVGIMRLKTEIPLSGGKMQKACRCLELVYFRNLGKFKEIRIRKLLN